LPYSTRFAQVGSSRIVRLLSGGLIHSFEMEFACMKFSTHHCIPAELKSTVHGDENDCGTRRAAESICQPCSVYSLTGANQRSITTVDG
jgi:hypothetical protein